MDGQAARRADRSDVRAPAPCSRGRGDPSPTSAVKGERSAAPAARLLGNRPGRRAGSRVHADGPVRASGSPGRVSRQGCGAVLCRQPLHHHLARDGRGAPAGAGRPPPSCGRSRPRRSCASGRSRAATLCSAGGPRRHLQAPRPDRRVPDLRASHHPRRGQAAVPAVRGPHAPPAHRDPGLRGRVPPPPRCRRCTGVQLRRAMVCGRWLRWTEGVVSPPG